VTKTLPRRVLITTHLDRIDSGERPSGRCNCLRSKARRHDWRIEPYPVTCLNCGNHWWENEDGTPVGGPPFEPLIVHLARINPKKYGSIEGRRRARVRSLPKTVDRFRWWEDAAINPLCDNALFPQSKQRPALTAEFLNQTIHQHRREFYRERFEAGETQAIFTCVFEDRDAYETDWIVKIREMWGRDGSPRATQNLRRLWQAAHERTRRREGKPAGVSWARVQRDISIYICMWEFDPRSGGKTQARIAHANNITGPLRQSLGYDIWGAYKMFVETFSTRCGSADKARDFLKLFASPRPHSR
jgi:hypothetical protein